jgi:hypothetical protein
MAVLSCYTILTIIAVLGLNPSILLYSVVMMGLKNASRPYLRPGLLRCNRVPKGQSEVEICTPSHFIRIQEHAVVSSHATCPPPYNL